MEAADNPLRPPAGWLLANTSIDTVASMGRDDTEDYKVWLAAHLRFGNRG